MYSPQSQEAGRVFFCGGQQTQYRTKQNVQVSFDIKLFFFFSSICRSGMLPPGVVSSSAEIQQACEGRGAESTPNANIKRPRLNEST